MRRPGFSQMLLANRVVFALLTFVFLANIIVYFLISSTHEKKLHSLQEAYQHLRISKKSSNDQGGSPYQKAIDEINKFYESLENPSGFMEMVVALKNQVNDFGLHIGKMNIKPEPNSDLSVVRYKTHLKVSGEYGKIKKLLAAITQSSRRLCIERILFQNRSDEKESVDLEIDFSTNYRVKK